MEYEFDVRVFHVDEQDLVAIPMFIPKKDNSMWVTLNIMSEIFNFSRFSH